MRRIWKAAVIDWLADRNTTYVFENRQLEPVKKTLFVLILVSAVSVAKATEPPRCYYQVRVYHYKTAAQQATLDQYFKEALKPALVAGVPAFIKRLIQIQPTAGSVY